MRKLIWSDFVQNWSSLEELEITGNSHSWRRLLKDASGKKYIYSFNSIIGLSEQKEAFELETAEEIENWETVYLVDREQHAIFLAKKKKRVGVNPLFDHVKH